MSKGWTPRSFDEACRRAGGRRRYNSERRTAAFARRREVMRLMETPIGQGYGRGKRLAAMLGVSVQTMSRDIKECERLRAFFQSRGLSNPFLSRTFGT